MKIKPNLFLNMSPQTTEEGALAFARNMKLDDDGNLVSDYGYKNIASMAGYSIVGHIVGLDNKIYFFTSNNKIIEYDEVTEAKVELNTNWTYNGGEIDGYVNTNQSGEKILTIGEYKSNGSVPLKHINLSFATIGDESFYCQAPTCPTTNLILKDTYVKTIPNGVYVFFIRYKIRKDVYTNWFLCSRPIFGGTQEKITTLQGGLSYINHHRDSAKSFVFQLTFGSNANKSLYSEFQLGFIITHDDATDARIWKSFDMSSFRSSPSSSENLIYFDYENVEEANIDDLLENTYELYNVRNITSFKNKLYIANYIESNINPSDIDSLKNRIHLSVAHTGGSDKDYRTMTLNGNPLIYNYNKGYYDVMSGRYPISAYLNKDYFLFSVSKLSKTDSKEKTDVVKFDLYWNDANHPDIALVYNIYNYLYNKEIFGPDFEAAIDFNNLSDIGINLALQGTNLWYYQRSNTPHPWDALGFTFGFGSFSEREYGKPWCRNGCSYFNKYTYDSLVPTGWVTRDDMYSSAAFAAMDNKLKEEVKERSFWAKAYIEITSGTNVYNIDYQDRMDLDNYVGYLTDLVPIDNSLFTTETISSTLQDMIETWVYNAIYGYIVGIDENGSPILNIPGTSTNIRVNSVSVKFKKFDFDTEVDEIDTSEDHYVKRFRVQLKTTDYVSLCTFNFKNGIIEVNDSIGNTVQASTLMPLTTYQPYVHFVDEHNIITNGVKLSSFTTGIAQSNSDVLYLRYSVDSLPSNKYKTFFISLVNVGDIVIEGFNYSKDPNNINTNIIHCLEIDSLLYNINDNITIKCYNSQGNLYKTFTNGKYYSSGSSYPPLAFGNCGFVSFTDSEDLSAYKIYIIIQRNKSAENINNLVKASSYIPLQATGQTTLPDGFYGSWLCLVKKPSFELSSTCYVSGKDVYAINRVSALSLTEFKSYIQVQNSVTYFVRSNFNLNYLSLTEDIADNIFAVGNASSGVKQVAKVINSATLSFIYELKGMYKDYFNKYFRYYDSDYKIDFDNTVRVSHVLSDETFNNSVFKFAATDYYNIPTDRGIIVNLFSIGNNIFVHTKSSFYKFDGNQTITSNNSDIQLQESEPFEIGVSQIFDSEYGYGGIDTKQSGCITFDSYFFYDKASNHIFAYGGNSQVQLIDGNIYKLLAYYKPSDCKTLHDELNCRVLFEFTSSRSEYSGASYKTFTLSYNYKTKTFVSFHDLSLVNVFAGLHRAYSYKSSLIRLFEPETAINTSVLVSNMNINQIFGGATTACIIEFGSQIYKKQATPFGIAVVLFPQNSIKEVVDSVKYVADVQQTDPETQSIPIYDVLVNPQITRTNPVVNFYVITDSCVSSLVNTNVNDNARPNSLLDYKGFKYDMGFWTSNYFRNNINKTNIYNYHKKYPNRDLDADNNSLVYGRYFIFVFDFKADTPIKFEELFMNTDKY